MVDKMFTIVYDLIAMLTQTFTTYVWPTRLKAIKVTASNFLINVFIHLNGQKAGVFDWPLNYSNIRKSVWLEAWSCALTGASSWLLVRHLKIFCGNPARPRPGENTALENWSLRRGGRLREVVATRGSTALKVVVAQFYTGDSYRCWVWPCLTGWCFT